MDDYPLIDPKTLIPLRVIQANLLTNPAYLDAENCPYSPELRDFLRIFTPGGAKNPEKQGVLSNSGSKWTDLEQEASQLFDDLKNFSSEISAGDVAEKMTYFRTATALLEKILGLNERAVGLKRIHEFQETVLQVFEDELTPDQRTKIMQRLRGTVNE